MQLLQTLMENEGVQAYLDESGETVTSAAKVFAEYPQVVKDHIMENIKDFIVPGDMQATYENIVIFTEAASSQFLTELTTMVAEGEDFVEA